MFLKSFQIKMHKREAGKRERGGGEEGWGGRRGIKLN